MLLGLVCCVIISSSAWNIKRYIWQQILVQISLHLCSEAQVGLVCCPCQRLRQVILWHKTVVIWPLHFYISSINSWPWTVFLKIQSFCYTCLCLERADAAVVWLDGHLVLILISFAVHDMVLLVLVKSRVPEAFTDSHASSCFRSRLYWALFWLKCPIIFKRAVDASSSMSLSWASILILWGRKNRWAYNGQRWVRILQLIPLWYFIRKHSYENWTLVCWDNSTQDRVLLSSSFISSCCSGSWSCLCGYFTVEPLLAWRSIRICSHCVPLLRKLFACFCSTGSWWIWRARTKGRSGSLFGLLTLW